MIRILLILLTLLTLRTLLLQDRSAKLQKGTKSAKSEKSAAEENAVRMESTYTSAPDAANPPTARRLDLLEAGAMP